MANIKQVLFVIGISILILGLIGWWVKSKEEKTEAPILENAETLDGPLAPKELEVNNPVISNKMNRVATFDTNKGTIKLELYEDTMPITTGNFIKLAQSGFYNGTKFHRVINNFMIQSGDPNSKGADVSKYGSGGPGYTIQDEFVKNPLLTNTRGSIAMANTGQPNSGGSQFFINLANNNFLDGKHPVFGKVILGMDVVDKIAAVQTAPGDKPVKDIKMTIKVL